jgi:hypothetical protein
MCPGVAAHQIASLNITNLIMVAGDAHLLAMDDGRNNDYSTYGGAGFPLFQSAPMDQYGSDKVRRGVWVLFSGSLMHSVVVLGAANGPVFAWLPWLSMVDHQSLHNNHGE